MDFQVATALITIGPRLQGLGVIWKMPAWFLRNFLHLKFHPAPTSGCACFDISQYETTCQLISYIKRLQIKCLRGSGLRRRRAWVVNRM